MQGLLGRGDDAAAIDAPSCGGIDQAEFHGHPVQSCQIDPLLRCRLQAQPAIGGGEFGEGRVGEHRAVAEDLVEDVRFLEVVHFFRGADEVATGKRRAASSSKKVSKGIRAGTWAVSQPVAALRT